MSLDIEQLLHAAAPTPSGGPDLLEVERRGASVRRWSRVLSIVAMAAGTFVIVGLVYWLAPFAAGRGGIDDPAGTPERDRPKIPEGPREVVVAGEFPEGEWGEYENKRWRLAAWGNAKMQCYVFEVGPPWPKQGHACSVLAPPEGDEAVKQEFIRGWGYVPGAGSVGDEEISIVYGELHERVQRLEFELTNGEVLDADLHQAPDAPFRYYVKFLPLTDNGMIVAYDGRGQVLQRKRLCQEGCWEGSSRPRDVPQRVPTMAERAAVFAVRAAAEAGLLDPLGDAYDYEATREVGGDRWEASFQANRCYRTPDVETCDRTGSGIVTVALEDGILRVVEATGPMSDKQRRALLSFQQELRNESGRFEFPYVRLTPPGDGYDSWSVRTSALWTGAMPPPYSPYGSWCELRAWDENGGLIYDSPRPFPLEVRKEESFRSGGILSVGFPRRVKEPARATWVCTEPDFIDHSEPQSPGG